MKPSKDKDGYLRVTLRGKKKMVYARISILVAYNFIGEPSKKIKDPTVDHIDGNILNNYYLNLRWLERSVNSSIRKKRGKSEGELNHEAKLNEKQITLICELLMQNTHTLKGIANIFKVSESTINNIKRKKSWYSITCNYNFPVSKIKRDKKGRFYNANSINGK